MSVLPPSRSTFEIELFGRPVGNGPYNMMGEPSRRHQALVIAELGVNHNGDVGLAQRMIIEAAKAGADVVKFQLRDLDACYGRMASPEGEGDAPGALAAYMPVLRKTALSTDDLIKLKKTAEGYSVGFLVTPFDPPSVQRLEGMGVGAYKIASCDSVNPLMLKAVADTGKPVIVSTGMCSEMEVWRTVAFLNSNGCAGRFVLMHALSNYPAAFADCQLHLIPRYKHNHGCPVGWSGHERGVSVSVSAVALGADVVERHFTLDRTLPGPDQAASLEPEGFARMVAHIRAFEAAYGDPVEDRRRPRGEYATEEVMRKSLVARRDIPAGATISDADVTVTGPGRGAPAWSILGVRAGEFTAARAVRAGEVLMPSDLVRNCPRTGPGAETGQVPAGGEKPAPGAPQMASGGVIVGPPSQHYGCHGDGG